MSAFLYPLNNPKSPLTITTLLSLPLKQEDSESRWARIEIKPDGLFFRDLSGKKMTLVNGQSCTQAYLHEGDLVDVGEESYQVSFIPPEQRHTFSISSKNISWQHQLYQLGSISKTQFPVLLLGPSGSGKDIVANAIHENSLRHSGPFVSVNCSAISDTLVESELFGHLKGSFTGAVQDRKGAFESARGGTLFLDEIGDLPLSMQAKLLRALENSEIRPIGSDRIIRTNVRIIAATHHNLFEKIKAGQFRSDLFYRLNVVMVRTPALCERMEDFETLIYSFAKQARVRFSYSAVEQLKNHRWPGNIRELRNLVARAAASFPGQSIEPMHIPHLLDQESLMFGDMERIQNSSYNKIKEIERHLIVQRLTANKGNQRQTARELGLPKSTLHDRIKSYGIDLENLRAMTGALLPT